MRKTPILHAPAAPLVAAPLILVACGTVAPFALRPLGSLLTPAAASISGADVHEHLALWHGFTPVLLTSLFAIAAGYVLFLNRSLLRRILYWLPRRLRGVVIFQYTLDGIYALAQVTARLSQGYTLATQSAIVLLAAFVPVAVALQHIELSDLMPKTGELPGAPETILVLLTVVSAYVTVRVRTKAGRNRQPGRRRCHGNAILRLFQCAGPGAYTAADRSVDRRAACAGIYQVAAG